MVIAYHVPNCGSWTWWAAPMMSLLSWNLFSWTGKDRKLKPHCPGSLTVSGGYPGQLKYHRLRQWLNVMATFLPNPVLAVSFKPWEGGPLAIWLTSWKAMEKFWITWDPAICSAVICTKTCSYSFHGAQTLGKDTVTGPKGWINHSIWRGPGSSHRGGGFSVLK